LQICTFSHWQIEYKMSKKNDFAQSLSGLSEADLTAKIKENEMRMKKLTFAHAIAPLENPQSIRVLRRDIARLKTQLRKTQIGA
jgi:large subunit ribosomal protein L29